jgi:hypothetical protein
MAHPLEYQNPRHRPTPAKRYWLPERSFGTCSFVGVAISIAVMPFLVHSSDTSAGILSLLFFGMPFAGFGCALLGCYVDRSIGWALLGLIVNGLWLMCGWLVMFGFELAELRLG